MKRVFPKTEQVAQAWAAGTHNDFEGARTSSNTWSREAKLFSYSTCIAQILNLGDGLLAALVTRRQYSSSTSKVQGEAAHAALVEAIPVFRVLDVTKPDDLTFDQWHMNNVADYEQRIAELLGRLARCQRFTAASLRYQALALIGEAHLYAKTFGIEWTYSGANPLGAVSTVELKDAA